MPGVSPADRDRGLRLVGTVTGAVAAVSLVAVGATTALAAGDTEQHAEVRAVVVATPTPQATGLNSAVSDTSTAPSHRRASAAHSATRTITDQARPHSTTTPMSAPRARSAPVATYSTPPPVPSTGS